jgi:hypothetical protein
MIPTEWTVAPSFWNCNILELSIIFSRRIVHGLEVGPSSGPSLYRVFKISWHSSTVKINNQKVPNVFPMVSHPCNLDFSECFS